MFRAQWRIFGWLLISLGIMGDVMGGLALLQRPAPEGLILHLGSILVWSVGLFLSDMRRSGEEESVSREAGQPISWIERPNMIPIMLGLCLFPGLGVLGYGLACVIARLTKRPRLQPLADEEETDYTDLLAGITTDAAASLNARASREVRPLIEVLNGTGFDTRQTALNLICREPGPLALALARRMLSDPDPDGRMLAAVAVSRMEAGFSEQLRAITERLEREPLVAEYPAQLGQLYAEYARADSPNAANRRFLLVQARRAFEQALTLEPARSDIRTSLVEILIALGEEQPAWDEAMILLAQCPDQAAGYMRSIEVAFCQRKFEDIAVLARLALAALPNTSEMPPTLKWWLEVDAQGEEVAE